MNSTEYPMGYQGRREICGMVQPQDLISRAATTGRTRLTVFYYEWIRRSQNRRRLQIWLRMRLKLRDIVSKDYSVKVIE